MYIKVNSKINSKIIWHDCYTQFVTGIQKHYTFVTLFNETRFIKVRYSWYMHACVSWSCKCNLNIRHLSKISCGDGRLGSHCLQCSPGPSLLYCRVHGYNFVAKPRYTCVFVKYKFCFDVVIVRVSLRKHSTNCMAYTIFL